MKFARNEHKQQLLCGFCMFCVRVFCMVGVVFDGVWSVFCILLELLASKPPEANEVNAQKLRQARAIFFGTWNES